MSTPGADGVSVVIEYATELFDQVTVERLGGMYRRLLLARAGGLPETDGYQTLPLLD